MGVYKRQTSFHQHNPIAKAIINESPKKRLARRIRLALTLVLDKQDLYTCTVTNNLFRTSSSLSSPPSSHAPEEAACLGPPPTHLLSSRFRNAHNYDSYTSGYRFFSKPPKSLASPLRPTLLSVPGRDLPARHFCSIVRLLATYLC